MTKADAELRQILDMAKDNLRRDGYLLPVLFVDSRAPTVVALGNMPGNAAARRLLLREVGRVFATRRPRAVILVIDAYLRADPDGVEVEGSLADDPRAEDCIVVASLDRRGRAKALLCPYERIPSLDGLTLSFKPATVMGEGTEAYLLDAFWEGVRAEGTRR
jgi:hypothetical protein